MYLSLKSDVFSSEYMNYSGILFKKKPKSYKNTSSKTTLRSSSQDLQRFPDTGLLVTMIVITVTITMLMIMLIIVIIIIIKIIIKK